MFFQIDSQQNIWAKLLPIRCPDWSLGFRAWIRILGSLPARNSARNESQDQLESGWTAYLPSTKTFLYAGELSRGIDSHSTWGAFGGVLVEDRPRCVEQKNLDFIDLKGFEDVESMRYSCITWYVYIQLYYIYIWYVTSMYRFYIGTSSQTMPNKMAFTSHW